MAYRVLAYVIAAVVAIQRRLRPDGVFAQLNWITKGGTKATLAPPAALSLSTLLRVWRCSSVALALLIVSFFAKIDKGVRWAVIVLAATFVQIALGILSHTWWSGERRRHGAFALILVPILAVTAGMRIFRSRAP